MTQLNLWDRLGSWINPFGRDTELPDLAKTDVLSSPEQSAPLADTSPRSLLRGRRDAVLDHMQTGYDKILDLVENIQEHLARQNERSDKVVDSLGDLARGVQDLPQEARRHTDTLGKIAGQVEVSNSHAQVMIGVLNDWPSASAAQRQALESINEHLRSSTEATRSLSSQLQALDRTVSTLGEATNQQIATLKVLQRSARHQEAQLVHVLTAQTRRFVMLFGVGLVMSAVALVAAGALLLS